MSLILEIRRTLDDGTVKKNKHRFKNGKSDYYEEYEGDLWVRLGHLPKSVNHRLVSSRLVRSNSFNEYTQPVNLNILQGKIDLWDAFDENANFPLVTYSNEQLAQLHGSTKPGIEFTIFENSGKESYARIVEERAYKDPPIRVGDWTFRRHQLITSVKRR